MEQRLGNIRDTSKYLEKLWPWDWLNDCFDYNIRVSDIDGLVERNGHFLILEGKSPGGELTTGQRRAFVALSKSLTDKSIIVVLFGEPGYPRQYICIHRGITTGPKSCSRETIKTKCRKWFEYANAN